MASVIARASPESGRKSNAPNSDARSAPHEQEEEDDRRRGDGETQHVGLQDKVIVGARRSGREVARRDRCDDAEERGAESGAREEACGARPSPTGPRRAR